MSTPGIAAATAPSAGTASETSGGGRRHRVVVIGSGFGGLFAAKRLAKAPVDVTVISRTAHHLFQPLLYQVATGILSEGEIAPATREVLRRQRNARVLLGEVEDIDLEARTVTHRALDRTTVTPYDSLVVAAGAGQSYFGNDHFAEFAPGMKSVDDALELRGRIFGVFEMAELEDDPAKREAWTTFVVVGAGATGVEMAGQIAELARRTLRQDFRQVDPAKARIILLDFADAVLGAYGPVLARKAQRELERLGVEVQLGAKVVGIDRYGIDVEDRDGSRRRIESRCKIWAAGVQASPLGRLLAEKAGAETDRSGRVVVEPDTSLPGHPEVFVVGDLMSLNSYPGVAQVAMQGARHAADQIVARLRGEPGHAPFRYRDKGSMAVISRFAAVAEVGRLRFAGFPAWFLWLVVHLLYLVGFKNRVTTLLHWTVSFIGRARSERTSTNQQVWARQAMRQLQWRELGGPAGAGGDPPAADGDQEAAPSTLDVDVPSGQATAGRKAG